MYRNPKSIDNCNPARIFSPGLDLRPATGCKWQALGRKGSFPRDCTRIALWSPYWPHCPAVVLGLGHVSGRWGDSLGARVRMCWGVRDA